MDDKKQKDYALTAAELAIAAFFLSACSLLFVIFALNNVGKFDDGSWNAISFSLASLQTVLAVFAFGGFWILRNATIRAAEAAACEEAPKITNKYMDEHAPALLRAILESPEGKALLQEIKEEIEDKESDGEDGEDSWIGDVDEASEVDSDADWKPEK